VGKSDPLTKFFKSSNFAHKNLQINYFHPHKRELRPHSHVTRRKTQAEQEEVDGNVVSIKVLCAYFNYDMKIFQTFFSCLDFKIIFLCACFKVTFFQASLLSQFISSSQPPQRIK
jgi:hypothetical protein